MRVQTVQDTRVHKMATKQTAPTGVVVYRGGKGRCRPQDGHYRAAVCGAGEGKLGPRCRGGCDAEASVAGATAGGVAARAAACGAGAEAEPAAPAVWEAGLAPATAVVAAVQEVAADLVAAGPAVGATDACYQCQ